MIVQIRNDLPIQVVCEGIHFKETQDLSFGDLSLFIERDLFTLTKAIAGSEFALSSISENGSNQFRIRGKLPDKKQVESTRKRVEAILWSYNHQKLIAKHGELYPQASRFTYKIEFSANMEVAHA